MSKDDDLDEFVKNLQEKIYEEEEETYSAKVISEYRNPTNFGIIEKPSATGRVKGPCGDTMRIDLLIKNDIIVDARFWTDGCGATLACGNFLMKLIKGKKVQDAENITSEMLLDKLGGLPEEHIHCTVLSVDALQLCIKNFHKL